MGSLTLLPNPLLLRPTTSSPTVSSISFSLARVSVSAARPITVHPLVLRSNKRAAGIVRAGETGEDESSDDVQAGEIAEDNSGAVAEQVEKPPRKTYPKFGDIIGILNKRGIEEAEQIKVVPDIRPGDIVEIKKLKANRRRLALYKGIVIAKSSAGVHTTIRIRYMSSGTSVELVFPVYSPTIKEIKVVSHRDVRRAKLFYYRMLLPRLITFKKK